MDPFGSLGRISIPAVMGNVSYEENPCWSLLVCSSYATHEMMILSQYLCLYLYIYIYMDVVVGSNLGSVLLAFKLELRDTSLISVTSSMLVHYQLKKVTMHSCDGHV